MSYVISDYNVLVHSVLPSLPPGLHLFLLISLHFGAQRAPTPHLAVCVSLSRLHFQLSSPHPALFCSCLSSFCIAVLLSHSCVEVFSVLLFILPLFYSALLCMPLYFMLCSCCPVLFCTVAFSPSANVSVWASVYLRSLNVSQEGQLLLY